MPLGYHTAFAGACYGRQPRLLFSDWLEGTRASVDLHASPLLRNALFSPERLRHARGPRTLFEMAGPFLSQRQTLSLRPSFVAFLSSVPTPKSCPALLVRCPHRGSVAHRLSNPSPRLEIVNQSAGCWGSRISIPSRSSQFQDSITARVPRVAGRRIQALQAMSRGPRFYFSNIARR